MKVLLIATNQAERYMDRMTVRPLPIGLAYLAAHVDERKHELEVLDLMFSKDAVADVNAAVERFEPNVVGLSIRNLDNQSYFNPVWRLPAVKEIVSHIHSTSDAAVVCGGPGFSILPTECLDYIDGDIGIAGDAASSFAELLERLEAGEDYRDIPGVVYRENGKAIATEGRSAAGGSDFHTPPRLDVLDVARYDKAGFGIGVVTKLAPSYYRKSEGREWSDAEDWRIRPVDEVISEIKSLNEKFGISKLFFIDSGLNIPLDYAKGLCKAIINSGLKLRWNSYLRPGDFDAELITLMKRSGCSLALLNDAGESFDALKRITDLCNEADLPFTLAFTFGEPKETEESVNAKLDFLKAAKPSFATLRVGNRVLPGTEAAAAALNEGLISSESELLEPTFYVAASVRDWIVERLRDEASAHPRWNLL